MTITLSASNASQYHLVVGTSNGLLSFNNTTGVFTFAEDQCETINYSYRIVCDNGVSSEWSEAFPYDTECGCDVGTISVTESYLRGLLTITVSAPNATHYYMDATSPAGTIQINNPTGVFIFNVNNCETVSYSVSILCDTGLTSDWSTTMTYNAPCALIGINPDVVEAEEVLRSTDGKLIVRPNPFDQEVTFTFKLNEPEKVEFQLYNTLGTLVMADAVNRDAGPINYNVQNDLPEGAYYYRIFFNKRWHTGKIIKTSRR